MERDSGFWLLLPRQIRQLPADLAIIAALAVLTGIAALAPVVKETPLRIVLGLSFVLFLPGYAFVAALFPEKGSPNNKAPTDQPSIETNSEKSSTRTERIRNEGIDGIERVALSFGLSIAISPLIGLGLNFTPFGIRLVPIVFAIGGFTLITTAVAAVRRAALPPEERFQVPFKQWYTTIYTELFEPETRADQLLNVVLVVSLLLAVSSVAYAVAVPKSGESFSEFYLLTENESSDLTASNYPSNFSVGESKPLVVGITNNEHQSETYDVVVQLQRVRTTNNSTKVLAHESIENFRTQLATNETWTQKHSVTPTMSGTRLRLVYLLYKDGVPSQPTIENAYRETHLWVNVSSSSTSATPAQIHARPSPLRGSGQGSLAVGMGE